MCGIWCCISSGNQDDLDSSSCLVCRAGGNGDFNTVVDRQQEFVSRRGPDVTSSHCFQLNRKGQHHDQDSEGKLDFFNIHLSSHVLWTQGENVTSQPYSNAGESKLMLFNGDIYSFRGALVEDSSEDSDNFENSKNDGITLFSMLEGCKSAEEMCIILGNLQGPFAFIYIDLLEERLWFARDFFGRESLLFSYDNNNSNCDKTMVWNLSSVSVFKNVFEVPTSGLFCFEMRNKELTLFPYSHSRNNVSDLQLEFFSILKSSEFVNNTNVSQDIIINLHFSSRLKLPTNVIVTPESDTTEPLIITLANRSASAEDFIRESISTLPNEIDLFLKHLRRSVKRRVSTLPPYCKNCLLLHHSNSSVKLICTHSKVGVLFSGGIDSTVLAYLAAEALPVGSTLDLITVAFSKDQNFNNAPDRETALASYKMLKERFEPQGKKINLVIVNVSKPEVEEKRGERVRDLIAPLKSVLDDSIGMCLWFAARGAGYLLTTDSNRNHYTTPARIMLLGSGADELLGGYGRHRSAYEKSGWLGLGREMQLEIDRISIRNLGRDNRIVSDHGICPRMPFLDEHVVDFLTSSCDLWVKCCPVNTGSVGRGSGEKLLLRAAAAKLFGDEYLSLALFPKRAMQFGSRIAKLENSKEKGGDSCHRLL